MKNRSALIWLCRVTGKFKIFIIVLIVIQALTGISSVVFADFLRKIIDSATDTDKENFFRYFLSLVLLVVMQIMLRAVSRYLEEHSRSSIENILKKRLFLNILTKDYKSVSGLHSGEWINRLTSDTVVCANNIVEIFPGATGMVVKLSGALIMILILEPGFGYIFLPGSLILLSVTYYFRKNLKKMHKKVQEKDGKVRIFFHDMLLSQIIIRSFATVDRIGDDSESKMSEHKKIRMEKNRFSNFCNISFSCAMNGMYLLGLGYCGYGIINATVTYGKLTAMLQLINQIQSPFANISGYMPKFYAMIASAERLMEVESFSDDFSDKSIKDDEIRNFYEKSFKSVVFKNAYFTYNTDSESEIILKNINLVIEKGDYIAFTGHSGCGKSTLLKLLMCMYPLDSGERLLCDINDTVHHLDGSWRRLFAYVPQGNHIMSGTIREAISFADKEEMYNEEKINYALKVSCADEFVSELESGIDTYLGERGQGISEGQMQRLAIARAIFSDAPILLLDEATSALDEYTEQKLLMHLKNMTNKTVVIITHRPAALDICNKIIEINEKGISEV